MPKAQNTSFMRESESFGPGAWAARHGVVYDPSRPSLLQRMSDAVAPKEFRARLAQILNSVSGLTTDVLQKIESSKMTIVLRSYGSKAMSYFLQDQNNNPVKRATAVRGVVSAASGPAVAKAKSVSAETLADLKTASAGAEFRNITDERTIQSALDGHREWKTFAEWFSGMTASIDARFTGLREMAANKPDRHVFHIPGQEGRTIDMERGLFNTVAAGYGPDGLPTKDMARGKRSTFIGRRVAVLPYAENQDRRKELVEVSRTWGDALLADFRASFKPGVGGDDIAAAAKKGYPIYKDTDGSPLAHLVYDSRGGNVLLPMKSLGFRDIGRKGDLTPTHFSPDKLEAKFGNNFIEYMKTAFGRRGTPEVVRSNGIQLRRVEKAQPVTSGFGLSFGEISPDINPANTAIVFANGSSNRFNLVHISTGNPISGLPVLGISNLPRGDYVRLTHETLKDWKDTSPSERGPLRDKASGTVRISDGWVMTHLDSDGRPHNTFDGPAIVQATRNEMGLEDNPRPITWAHHGTSMPKEDFMKLRYQERLAARMADEKVHANMLDDPFGLSLEKNRDMDTAPKLPGMH